MGGAGTLGGILGCFFCDHLSRRCRSFPRFGAPEYSFFFFLCMFLSIWDRCRILMWKDGGRKIHNCSMRKSCAELSFLLESSLFNHQNKMDLGSAGGNIWSKLKIRFSRGKAAHNYYFSIKNVLNQSCLLFLIEFRDIFIDFDTSVASTKINGDFLMG